MPHLQRTFAWSLFSSVSGRRLFLLVLYAVELRIGSAKQILPGIDTITHPCVADRHPQQIRHLGTRELVVDCLAQAHDVLLCYRLLEHYELIAAITCDKATRRRADIFGRGHPPHVRSDH